MSRTPTDAHREPHVDDVALLALLAGDLPAGEIARVEQHLLSCGACRQSLEGFRVVQQAFGAARAEPSPFASARMKRQVAEAIGSRRVMRPRLVRRSRALAAVALAALSGAAVAMTASRTTTTAEIPLSSRPEEAALEPARVAPEVPAVVLTPARALAPTPPVKPPPAAIPPRETERPQRRPRMARTERVPHEPPATEPNGVRVAVAPGTPSPAQALEAAWQRALAGDADDDWLTLGDAFAQAGDLDRAADAWVRALPAAGGDSAAQRLATLVRDGKLEPDAVLARLAATNGDDAETLRLRCELALKHRADRPAVEACQLFGRAHPAHPAVRSLAMAAGQVAETRLHDLPLAVAEYSRALMVSEYAGIPSTDALLARSRARAKLGERDEAQADLRLYLHVMPEAFHQPDVRALADDLAVPAP